MSNDVKNSAPKEKVVPGDTQQAQIFRGWPLFLLSAQAVGAIYGDIGTSPLYVYSSTFTSAPNREELICAASLIIWTLVIMVSVKYVILVLLADDNGQGGTLALYHLLQRYVRFLAAAGPS
jgi:KUP system potassium uptake protein